MKAVDKSFATAYPAKKIIHRDRPFSFSAPVIFIP
jgi:hypothetical protein